MEKKVLIVIAIVSLIIISLAIFLNQCKPKSITLPHNGQQVTLCHSELNSIIHGSTAEGRIDGAEITYSSDSQASSSGGHFGEKITYQSAEMGYTHESYRYSGWGYGSELETNECFKGKCGFPF